MDQRNPKHIPDGLSVEALIAAPFSLVLTDPTRADNPIIFVNPAFEKTTGYSADEAVGRNCRFLQGEDTQPAAIDELRAALRERRETTVDLLNYRKNGEPFWNRLYMAPLGDVAAGEPFFIGIQTDLGAAPEAYARLVRSEQALVEVRHRVKNHLSMIVGMIRLQARESQAGEEFRAVARRVEALQLLYEELSELDERHGDPLHENIDLTAYSERIARALVRLANGLRLKIEVSGAHLMTPLSGATQIGLAISEIVTNAIQHGFSGRDRGTIRLHLSQDSDGTAVIEVSDDGSGLPEGLVWPSNDSLGGRIVNQLVSGMTGELHVGPSPEGGTLVRIRVPPDQLSGMTAIPNRPAAS